MTVAIIMACNSYSGKGISGLIVQFLTEIPQDSDWLHSLLTPEANKRLKIDPTNCKELFSRDFWESVLEDNIQFTASNVENLTPELHKQVGKYVVAFDIEGLDFEPLYRLWTGVNSLLTSYGVTVVTKPDDHLIKIGTGEQQEIIGMVMNEKLVAHFAIQAIGYSWMNWAVQEAP